MHICKDTFRRRNSLLHKVNKATKTNKANKADKISRRSK